MNHRYRSWLFHTDHDDLKMRFFKHMFWDAHRNQDPGRRHILRSRFRLVLGYFHIEYLYSFTINYCLNECFSSLFLVLLFPSLSPIQICMLTLHWVNMSIMWLYPCSRMEVPTALETKSYLYNVLNNSFEIINVIYKAFAYQMWQLAGSGRWDFGLNSPLFFMFGSC